MSKTVYFMGGQYNYGNVGWLDDYTFTFDFGDGEMINNGDSIFIHLEYHKDEDKWIEEVWWNDDDDYLAITEWIDYDHCVRKDINNIEKYIMENLM